MKKYHMLGQFQQGLWVGAGSRGEGTANMEFLTL